MNQKEKTSTLSQDDFLIQILKKGKLTTAFFETQLTTEKSASELLVLANFHGITPQLQKAVKHLDKPLEMADLQSHYQNIVQANLLLTAYLLTVVKALEKENFAYLSIKGPTLSQELHSDISMRQFSDIDLFVDEKDLYAIAELIITLDYKPELPLSLLKRKKFLALDNDFSFRHTRSNALLELHWKLFPNRHKMPLDFTKLSTASKSISLQQRDIRTLSTAHNLLYLSLHGAKHIFERYEWVYDIHTLIKNNATLDLEAIYREAKEDHLDTPLLLALFLSQHLFDTPLPTHFQVYKTEQIQVLIDQVLSYYTQGFVHWDESDKKRARFLFLSELFQDQEHKTLWLFKSLFKTSPVDVITFSLPDALDFLYPVLRPFRLTYKHLFTKKPTYA